MAITIQSSPQTFSPVYNPLYFVVSSNNTGQSNFKYVADIYVSGVSGFVRQPQSADPDSGYGHFDVHRILENYVSSDISKAAAAFSANTNSYVAYEVKFGEQYGPSSGVVTYPALSLSGIYYGFNGSLPPLEFVDYDDADYIASLQLPTRPYTLTANPNRASNILDYRMRSGQYAWSHMMASGVNELDHADVTLYDSNANFISSHEVRNAFRTLPSLQSRFLRFPIGPGNLPLIPLADIITGGAISMSGVGQYTIEFEDGSGNQVMESVRVVIDNTCTKYDVYTLHFKNRLGGYDTFAFTRRSRKPTTVTRDKFLPILGAVSGGTWSYAKSARQESILNTVARDRLILTSDYLTENESVWLKDLILSNEAYHDHSTHGLVAVNVLTADYEEKNYKNDKAFVFTIEVEYSMPIYPQRG